MVCRWSITRQLNLPGTVTFHPNARDYESHSLCLTASLAVPGYAARPLSMYMMRLLKSLLAGIINTCSFDSAHGLGPDAPHAG